MTLFKERYFFYIIFFICFACISCNYRQQQVLFEKKVIINASNVKELPTGYKIKYQDVLQIRNLQNIKYIVDEPIGIGTSTSSKDQEKTYLVEKDGTVALPVLGRVKVAGLTRAEAASVVEMLYRKELKDPIIELKVVNMSVTLLGEIARQGVYTLVKDQTSLIEVIGEAGGLTQQASSKNVKIIRGGMENPQVIAVDLGNVGTLSDPNTILQNNDVIYISQNKRAIRSEKLQTMSSILQPIVVLLNTALIIYTLAR